MAAFGTNMESRRNKGVILNNYFDSKFVIFFSLFAGVLPRMFGIALGGFMFFGAYEKSRSVFSQYL